MRPTHDLQAMQTLLRQDRQHGLAVLNDTFRAGTPPAAPLQGRYAGQLVMLDLAPGLTSLVNVIVAAWLPWKGKTFDAALSSGDNIFTRDSLLLVRLFNPLHRGFTPDGAQTYRAFTFRTYVAPGLEDPDRQVLKIDYNLPVNPALTIRRVLDELVQVGENTYLGKAHVRWWWGKWQCVAYFALSLTGRI